MLVYRMEKGGLSVFFARLSLRHCVSVDVRAPFFLKSCHFSSFFITILVLCIVLASAGADTM